MRTHTVRGQELLDKRRWHPRGGADRARLARALGRSRLPGWPLGAVDPLAARIIACCDAFYAMTTERPYRQPISQEVALRELVDNAGTQFDPHVVQDVHRGRAPTPSPSLPELIRAEEPSVRALARLAAWRPPT